MQLTACSKKKLTAEPRRPTRTNTHPLMAFLGTGLAAPNAQITRLKRIKEMIKAHKSGDRLRVRWEAPDGEKELAFFHHQGLPSGPDIFISGHPALRGSLSDLLNCAFKTVKSVCCRRQPAPEKSSQCCLWLTLYSLSRYALCALRSASASTSRTS